MVNRVFLLTPAHSWHWKKPCPWKCQCLLSAINCFAATSRGIRLERGSSDGRNRSCSKEKRRNELLLAKPISPQTQAGFLWFPEIHSNRAEKTSWTYVFMPRTLLMPFRFFLFFFSVPSVFFTHVFVALWPTVLVPGFPSTFPRRFPKQKDKTNSRAPSPRGYKAPVLSWFFLGAKVESNSWRYLFMDKASAQGGLQRRNSILGGIA